MELQQENRKMGRIRKVTDQGYGFLMEDEIGSIFFHQSQLISAKFKDLTVGSILEFETFDSLQGPKARNILVVQDYPAEREDAGTTKRKKRR